MEFHRKVVAQFQVQDCKLTLREALEEFYAINSHLFSKPVPENSWTELLVNHDVGHVFFGVNTTIMDETAGDIWTVFGTDIPFREYLKYTATPEAKELIREIGTYRLIKALFFGLPLLFAIYFRTRRMTRKWPHEGYQSYMDRELGDLRKEFGVRVL